MFNLFNIKISQAVMYILHLIIVLKLYIYTLNHSELFKRRNDNCNVTIKICLQFYTRTIIQRQNRKFLRRPVSVYQLTLDNYHMVVYLFY